MNAMYTDKKLKRISDLVTHLENPQRVDIILSGTKEQQADWIFERLVRFKYLTLRKGGSSKYQKLFGIYSQYMIYG